ncbi:flagellar protein FlgN [bacterium]|nr:flagellar protein FlgN [bacterium]
MELVWRQLLNIIDRLSQQCDRVTQVSLRMREAIIANRVTEVGEIVIEQEQEMQAFQDLEKEREALLQSLQIEFNLDEKEISSERLLAFVPPQWSNDYREKINTLRIKMETVKQEQNGNRKLLQRSQHFMDWLVKYLVTPEGSAPIYDAGGEQDQKSYYHIINQNM